MDFAFLKFIFGRTIEDIPKLVKFFHAFEVGIFRADTRNTDHFLPENKERILKAIEIPVLE